MVCQTRSRAKQQAEQQNIRQTRSSTKRQTTGTALSATRQQTKKKDRRRTVRAASSITRERTKQRTKKVAHVPTSFNHLPTEIRLMIWDEFVRTPRIIHIDLLSRPTQAVRGYSCHFESQTWWQPKESEQVCPLLGVSRESRFVALKEPFIHFRIEYPALQPKRFHMDNTISRNFGVRSRDIVFFDNSESLPFKHSWIRGNKASIANVMIDLDISVINYKNSDAIPMWTEMFRVGQRLADRLGNWKCLQSIYCLIRDPTDTAADQPQHYDVDSIQELTPGRASQFPEHREDLTRWLQEFALYPQTINGRTVFTSEDYTAAKNVWKNVSVVRGIEGS